LYLALRNRTATDHKAGAAANVLEKGQITHGVVQFFLYAHAVATR
jgi:hypothetical protein